MTRFRFPAAALWLLVLSAAPRANADFVYADFSSTTNLNLLCSAAAESGRLRLTPNTPELSGAAWYTAPQNVQGGFQTTFAFQLAGGNGSDGFAFLVQNSSVNALFGPGGRLGYGGFGAESGGIPNSVAVQFDTFQNAENNDPSNNYLSVQSRGMLPNSTNHVYTLGQATPAADLNDGAVHQVTIDYSPGTLSIYFDGSASPLLVTSLNLGTLLSLDSGAAFVGFTAGTGGDAQNHDILNWQFASVPEPPAQALALLGLACSLVVRRQFRRADHTKRSRGGRFSGN